MAAPGWKRRQSGLLPAGREGPEAFPPDQFPRHIIRDSEGAGEKVQDFMNMLHAYLKVFP